MSQLTVVNLEKTYKKRNVVNQVSLEIGSGEIVGLLGPNGAGKTTTFYMIVGLIPCDSGHIKIDNSDITLLPMHARAAQGLGYLPQEASIFRKMSVAANIMSILELRPELDRKQRKQQLNDLLEKFNLTEIRDAAGISLSGGERRRVEIARLLARTPQFILLDEPFAGIDPISVNEIKHMIRQLQKDGIGILITDHNVRETLNICERAYIVSRGKLICKGSPQTILSNPEVKSVYLGENFEI